MVSFLGFGLVVNGLFMLFSPKAWFRLPGWFAGRGSLIETKYGNGFGAMQVRVLGAIFVAVPMWCVYDALSK